MILILWYVLKSPSLAPLVQFVSELDSAFFRSLTKKSHIQQILLIQVLLAWQVIAVNSSKAAEGEVYLDDGKSFEFQHGAYIHRRFTYSNGRLTSSNKASATLGGRKFASQSTVERIILLGLSPEPKTALVEPGNHKVDIERGPLLLRGGTGSSVLTIRKPNVNIADDWTIKIL